MLSPRNAEDILSHLVQGGGYAFFRACQTLLPFGQLLHNGVSDESCRDANLRVRETVSTSFDTRSGNLICRRLDNWRAPVRVFSASDATHVLTSAGVPPAVVPERTEIVKRPPVSYEVSENFDPLANLRASQAKHPGFHYRPPTAADEKDLT